MRMFTRLVYATLLTTVMSAALSACTTADPTGNNVAAVSQRHGWVDAALLPYLSDGGDTLVSNAGAGN